MRRGGRSGRGRWRQLATHLREPLLHFGQRQAQEGGAGGEHEVEAGRDELLVAAENLAQAALGAVALDGIADGGAGGHDADAGGRGGVRFRTQAPDEEKRAAVGAATEFARGAEVAVALHALRGAKALRR